MMLRLQLFMTFFLGLVTLLVSPLASAAVPSEWGTLDTPYVSSDSLSFWDPSASAPNWDSIINQGGAANVLFGIRIGGPSPYVRNPGILFAPASNTKLFTTAAALKYLGPEFRIETELRWQQIDASKPGSVTQLTLVGNGDPTWAMSEFGEDLNTRIDGMVDALLKEGVTEVQGDIRVAAGDSRWNKLAYPQGWSLEDHTACYGALAQAFNLDINCAVYTVSGPAKGQWEDSDIPIPVDLKVRRARGTQLTVQAVDMVGVPGARFVITGTWASGSAPVSFILPIQNTSSWIRNRLMDALEKKGIQLIQDEPVAAAPEVRHLTFYSPPLREILKPFMKKSINVVGEALFKIMGQRLGPADVDLMQASRQVMKDFVATIGNETARSQDLRIQNGFYSDQVALFDGSGVSRDNFVSTAAIMTLLTDLNRSTDFPVLWESLPIAGVDGTLANRMKRSAAEGVLRAKTGTLRGVYNLSGYVPHFVNSSGTIDSFVPFVMLTKTNAEKEAASRAAQDRVGAALATAVNPAGIPRDLP